MSPEPTSLENAFLPEEPLHPQGAAFFAQVTEMLDGKPKDPAVVEAAMTGWDGILEKIAGEQYHIGSMLLGEGEETIGLIELVVANLNISACSDHRDARHQSRVALAAEAIRLLQRRDPASLASPGEDSGPVSCIEDDDLSATGVTHAELAH